MDCNRCGGEGKLWQFSGILAGVCFACNGTGIKHKVKRTKTFTTYFIVSCEGTTYPRFKTELEAQNFAEEVQCMHLEVPVVKQVQHSQTTTTKIKI